jgi:hypothetical protein
VGTSASPLAVRSHLGFLGDWWTRCELSAARQASLRSFGSGLPFKYQRIFEDKSAIGLLAGVAFVAFLEGIHNSTPF